MIALQYPGPVELLARLDGFLPPLKAKVVFCPSSISMLKFSSTSTASTYMRSSYNNQEEPYFALERSTISERFCPIIKCGNTRYKRLSQADDDKAVMTSSLRNMMQYKSSLLNSQILTCSIRELVLFATKSALI